MTERDAGTYQMLWDCPYCGTKKLLGLTHRHCPECGAEQDPTLRYFPSDAEKVAVENHVFYGADRICPSCKAPNGARANHCGTCGAPLEGAKEAARREDQMAGPGQGFSGETRADAEREARRRAGGGPAKARPRSRKFVAVGIAVGIVAVLIAVAVILTRKEPVIVTAYAHAWSREIRIESFAARQESAWCDSMPRDAYNVTRGREVRSHRRIPDGETCTTRRIDRGDGTFSEKKDCTTRYREEPIYDDKCRFTVNRWGYARSVSASGQGLSPAPYWPTFTLSREGECLGCERRGSSVETYRVFFVDEKRRTSACDYDLARWAAVPDGSQWRAEANIWTGSLDCGTLAQAGGR